jgi:hypothetical protein
LSQALVAFTIEFDNEFEHQTPHVTTASLKNARTSGSLPGLGPWLTSMVMFSNFMQYVPDAGITVAELRGRARAEPALAGMERWGYVFVKPDPNDSRPKPPLRDWVVSPKVKGRMAQKVWPKLFDVIEGRWRARYGDDKIDKLRESLRAMVREFDVELPEYLPVLGYGLIAQLPHIAGEKGDGSEQNAAGSLRLPTLLSRVLLALTIDFERESELSLAICANIVRVVSEQGTTVRDLPRLSGVSKEAIKIALGLLAKRGHIAVESQPGSSQSKPNRAKATGIKMVHLITKGVKARQAYRLRLDLIEQQWRWRFGEESIRNLRESLEPLVGDGTAQASPLFRGLEPYPEGWRASVAKPETLPHYPMVLHRGGYPDGS